MVHGAIVQSYIWLFCHCHLCYVEEHIVLELAESFPLCILCNATVRQNGVSGRGFHFTLIESTDCIGFDILGSLSISEDKHDTAEAIIKPTGFTRDLTVISEDYKKCSLP